MLCAKKKLNNLCARTKSLFSLPVAEPTDSVLVKLVLSLLQLCKLAANHPGGADILGIKK